MDPAWNHPDFGVVMAEAGVQHVSGTASAVSDARWVTVASWGAVAVLGSRRRLRGKDNSILFLVLFNLHPLPSPLPQSSPSCWAPPGAQQGFQLTWGRYFTSFAKQQLPSKSQEHQEHNQTTAVSGAAGHRCVDGDGDGDTGL